MRDELAIGGFEPVGGMDSTAGATGSLWGGGGATGMSRTGGTTKSSGFRGKRAGGKSHGGTATSGFGGPDFEELLASGTSAAQILATADDLSDADFEALMAHIRNADERAKEKQTGAASTGQYSDLATHITAEQCRENALRGGLRQHTLVKSGKTKSSGKLSPKKKGGNQWLGNISSAQANKLAATSEKLGTQLRHHTRKTPLSSAEASLSQRLAEKLGNMGGDEAGFFASMAVSCDPKSYGFQETGKSDGGAAAAATIKTDAQDDGGEGEGAESRDGASGDE